MSIKNLKIFKKEFWDVNFTPSCIDNNHIYSLNEIIDVFLIIKQKHYACNISLVPYLAPTSGVIYININIVNYNNHNQKVCSFSISSYIINENKNGTLDELSKDYIQSLILLKERSEKIDKLTT